jgi:hypothetical protein
VRILGGSLEQSLKMWEHLRADVERAQEQGLDCKLAAQRVKTAAGSVAAVLSQSQKAVRGLRVQKLRCDEVELFDTDVWEAAQLVTKSQRDLATEHGVVAGVVEVFSTLHRPWGLMQKIVETARERGTRVIKWCLLDVLERCPIDRDCDACALLPECGRRAKTQCNGFLSIDDAIRMKRRVSAETWAAEMLCQRPATKGCVFPTFEQTIHVREYVEMRDEAKLWLGIDFGFKNPFVCLWVRKSADGVVHVIDEYVQEGKTVHEHVKEIGRRPWGAVFRVACDPAGSATNEQTAMSNVQVLREAGYIVRYSGSRIVEGVEMIRTALRTGSGECRLFIHPRCKRLIRAMQAYRYGEVGGEVPLKDGEHDHPIDALRYFFFNSKGNKTDVRGY